MKTYPAILKSKIESDTRIMLAYDKHQSTCISDDRFDFHCGFNFDTSDAWQNITRKCLADTYGKVESREHAEFIKLLAESNEIGCSHKVIDEHCNFFYVVDGCLFFSGSRVNTTGKYKQITLPLPPKEEESMNNEMTINVTNNTNSVVQIKKDEETKVVTVFINKAPSKESKPEKAEEMQNLNKTVSDSLNENGDNLMFGGEDKIRTETVTAGDGKPFDVTPLGDWQGDEVKFRKVGYTEKEWPAIGDKALTASNQKVYVLATHEGEAWVKYDGAPIGTGYASVKVATLSKPPTPFGKLAKLIFHAVDFKAHPDSVAKLTTAIINGEIEGLTYKPQ